MTCNTTVLHAYQNGQLGFALSDSGWLMPWYFGVIWALQKVGVIDPGTTPIGAVSGGSVAAAASCLGLDFENYIMPAVQTTAAMCRSRNMCAGTLANWMGPSLKSLLLPAASNETKLERCHNSTDIYVSEGHPKIHIARGGSNFAGSTPLRINSSDAEAFVDGIVATWYIPYWSDLGSFATEYQGKPAYEGFYSNPMPCPAGSAVCVRLSSRFPGPLMAKDGGLSSFRSMFDNPSIRAIENVLGMASSRWFDPSEPPAPQPADIYPGKYNKCKYTPLELAYTLALTPGTKADLEYLFDLGKADGAAWAAEVGLSNPAACSSGAEGVGAGSGSAASGVDTVNGADSAAAASDSLSGAENAVTAPTADAASMDLADSAAATAEITGSGDAYGPFSADIVVGSAPAALFASSVEAVGQQQLEIAAAADAVAFTAEVPPHAVVVQLRQQHRMEVAAEADAAAALEAESANTDAGAIPGSDGQDAAAAAAAVDTAVSSTIDADGAPAVVAGVAEEVAGGSTGAFAVASYPAGAAADSAASAAAADGSTAAPAAPADAEAMAVSTARSASKRLPFWLRGRGL